MAQQPSLATSIARIPRGLLWLFQLFGVGSLIALFVVDWVWVVGIDLALLAVFLSARYQTAALYCLAAVYPLMGWQWIVGSWEVPLVDAVAILVFFGWMVRRMGRLADEPLSLREFPVLFLFAMFWLASAVSMVHNTELMPAIKYLVRPILFFYIMFVSLPVQLIDRAAVLQRVIRIMVVVGVLVAITSLFAGMSVPGPWYAKRAVPMTIAGINWIGGNQNAVAEIMVVTIPLLLLWFSWLKTPRQQNYAAVVLMILTGVLLVTFSRSGWIALGGEMILMLLLRGKSKINYRVAIPAIAGMIVLVASLYVMVWNELPWVQSSNQNRLLLTSIALSHAVEHPYIGHGLNTFLGVIGDTFVYVADFGSPLESHGFMQKILLEQGLIGLATFGAILVYILWLMERSWKYARNESERFMFLCLFAMVAGVIAMQLFSTSYYVSRMWFPIGVALAAVQIYVPRGDLRLSTWGDGSSRRKRD